MRRLALLSLAACSHSFVLVQPVEVARVSGKLHATGHANVIAFRATQPMIEPVAMAGTLDGIPVATLLAECPPMAFDLDAETRARYPRCELFQHGKLIVRDERHLAGAVKGGVAVAALAGIVTCAFACGSPYNYAADGVLALGGAAVAVGIGGLIYALTKMD